MPSRVETYPIDITAYHERSRTVEPHPYPSLAINLLGTFDVRADGKPVLGWRSEKTKWLLAFLVLRPGEATFALLASTLWEGGAEAGSPGQEAALASVRQSLANLCKLLGPERFLKPTRSSVLLDAEGAHVDVLAFDAAMEVGDLPGLQRAVTLYQGTLLPGCDAPWIDLLRETRRQQYADALRQLTLDATASGDYAAAEGYLRLAIAADPLREESRSDLMRLLATRHEYPAALGVYRDLVARLRDDPKARPSANITRLYYALQDQSQQQRLPGKAEPPDGLSLAALPHPLSDLVGREQALREVASRLLFRRMVTLTGPPGVGKTQLALRAARDAAEGFPDGQAWADLTEASTARDLTRRLAALLDVRIPRHLTEGEALAQALQSGQRLLVLDNCDHLQEGGVRLLGDLLSQCPHLHVLATSRQVLGLTGESAYAVCPLALPDAAFLARPPRAVVARLSLFASVQLFLARARDVDSAFTLTAENSVAVGTLCRHLEGLPLALEMAAAWAAALTPQQMVARLADPLALLVNERVDARHRHHSLAAAIRVSVSLLPDSLPRLFAQLAIFRGGWTEAAAAAVCDAPATLPALRQLQQRSLITATNAGPVKRFRLLEPVRAFARAQLAPQEQAAAARRHAGYFLRMAEEAEPRLRGPEQAAWLQSLEHDHDNLRAALRWACDAQETEMGLRLAGALGRFWLVRGHYQEGQEWLARLLGIGEVLANGVRVKAVQAAGNLAFHCADYREARAFFTEMLALAEALGNRRGMASALGNLGNVASEEGDLSQARDCFERVLAVFRDLEETRGITLTLGNLAVLACRAGDYKSACAHHEESIALFTELGDHANLALALGNLADVRLSLGEDALAERLLRQGLTLCRAVDSPYALVHSLSLCFCLAASRREMERAAVLLGAEQVLRERIGVPLPPEAVAQHERHRALVEGAVGREAFQQVVMRGSALSPEEIVAFALGEGDGLPE